MAKARNLVYKLMVMGPVVLTTGIAVESRTRFDGFQPIAAGAEQQARITAYVEPVRKAKAALRLETAERRTVAAREVARLWIQRNEAGELKPLEPVAYEDTSRDGVKNEIILAANDVAVILNRAAKEELAGGKADQAMGDATLALSMIDRVKFSDFSSLGITGMLQRRSLNLIKDAASLASPQAKEQTQSRLARLTGDDNTLEHMANLARLQYFDYQERQGLDPVAIRETDRLVSSQEAFRPNADLSATVKELRQGFMAAANNSAPELFSILRLGCASELETRQRAKETLAVLTPASGQAKATL